MRVLVTWGSKRGGTEGIARVIGEALQQAGIEDVEMCSAEDAGRPIGFDAVIVGGALYASRWHHTARRFVNRHERALKRVPVWFFSSGPLDGSAEEGEIPPTRMVTALMDRVGAQGHTTFGGRLTPDARGLVAHALAKKYAGDFRNMDRARVWARDIAQRLPAARPGIATVQPGRSVVRLVLHGVVGWALCAAVMGVLLWATTPTAAELVHAFAAPAIFALVAHHYFRERGARSPLPAATVFAVTVALLDLGVVSGLVQRDLAMFTSILGSWLPFALIFFVAWAMGELAFLGPVPKQARQARA